MGQIILTDEQLQVFRHAMAPVEVCHPSGKVLATIDPVLTPEFIAEMKRRAAAPGPRYTSEQVRNHLRALEEAYQREGGFDRDRMLQILREIRAAESK